MEPINYAIDVKSPMESTLAGFQGGLAMRQASDQQKAAQLQLEAQQQMRADLANVSSNPTPAAVSSLMIKYPQMSEQFKRTYDVMNSEQQKSRLGQATQVYAALNADKPEVAQQLLLEQAAAARNSGLEQDAKTAETIAELVKLHPETAKTSTGMFLAHAMGPEKFTETFTKLQNERRESDLAPSKLTESQAKAHKASVDAKFAESDAALDLQKKGWDITKIQEDIKIAKENSRIAALNAAVSREGNQIKRQEMGLKLDEMKQKRDDAVRGKIAEVESARGSMDNMLNTADRILKTPIGVVESAAGPISSRLPTASADTADFEALVETLGSQAFMAQIPNIKGMGALSNAEGEKLQAALQNFNLKQSPARLMENVKEAQRLILKARKNVTERHGVPETVPDTPQAAPGGGEIDALLKKYGAK